jgi:hypothetical protein
MVPTSNSTPHRILRWSSDGSPGCDTAGEIGYSTSLSRASAHYTAVSRQPCPAATVALRRGSGNYRPVRALLAAQSHRAATLYSLDSELRISCRRDRSTAPGYLTPLAPLTVLLPARLMLSVSKQCGSRLLADTGHAYFGAGGNQMVGGGRNRLRDSDDRDHSRWNSLLDRGYAPVS